MISNGTVQISLLEKEKVKISRITNRLRAFLHGGDHYCKRDQIKMRDNMDGRVTSPTWGPPPPSKQAIKGIYHALCYLFQNIKGSSHQLNSETYGPVSKRPDSKFIFFV